MRRGLWCGGVPAAVLLAGLVGCGNKRESESDSSGGGSAAPPAKAGDGLPPAPPPGPVTAYFGFAEIASARRETERNLRNIALAQHNFHDTMGHLPAGLYDASGKKLGLSWRVAILLHIEEEALYKEFKLDEPWDSDHNKKLIGRMPKVFAPPGSRVAKGYTYYRMFTGPEAVLPPLQPGPPAQPGQTFPRLARGRGLVGITDGTANTILVAEADPVIWTKPDELEYDAKKPLPKLGGVFEDGFYVAMCDGSVRFWKRSTPEKVLRAAITAAGGEVVQLP